MSFYGFNFQNSPQFSRLFGQNTMQNAQAAYGQGMSQFKPYDARGNAQADLEKQRAARQPVVQPQTMPSGMNNLYVGKDGRVIDITKQQGIESYLNEVYNRDRHNDSRAARIVRNNQYAQYGLTPLITR